MTIQQVKDFIRAIRPNLPELYDLADDHDRLERENAELRAALDGLRSRRNVERILGD